MNRDVVLKYVQLVVVVALCLVADQWTKHLAATRLATHRPGAYAHSIVLTVPPELDTKTTRELIEHEFGAHNTPAEIDDILRGVTSEAAVLLSPSRPLKAGDVVEVRRREITVIEDHFDLQYARNPGAAFSFLADADSAWTTPFFLGVGLIAVIVILWILRGATLQQQLLIWALALICGGAIGNLVDRVRFGYVIDFIVWKWTDAYRWPTFNLADSFIVVGVGLMAIQMARDTLRERREARGESS